MATSPDCSHFFDEAVEVFDLLVTQKWSMLSIGNSTDSLVSSARRYAGCQEQGGLEIEVRFVRLFEDNFLLHLKVLSQPTQRALSLRISLNEFMVTQRTTEKISEQHLDSQVETICAHRNEQSSVYIDSKKLSSLYSTALLAPVLSPYSSAAHISSLHPDLALRILEYLRPKELCLMGAVSRRFCYFTGCEVIWINHLRRYFPSVPIQHERQSTTISEADIPKLITATPVLVFAVGSRSKMLYRERTISMRRENAVAGDYFRTFHFHHPHRFDPFRPSGPDSVAFQWRGEGNGLRLPGRAVPNIAGGEGLGIDWWDAVVLPS